MLVLISNMTYKMNNIPEFSKIEEANELTMLTNKKIQAIALTMEEGYFILARRKILKLSSGCFVNVRGHFLFQLRVGTHVTRKGEPCPVCTQEPAIETLPAFSEKRNWEQLSQ